MAMNGLSQSASDSMEPVARSRERCGARSTPFLMMSERMGTGLFQSLSVNVSNQENIAAGRGLVTLAGRLLPSPGSGISSGGAARRRGSSKRPPGPGQGCGAPATGAARPGRAAWLGLRLRSVGRRHKAIDGQGRATLGSHTAVTCQQPHGPISSGMTRLHQAGQRRQ